MFGNRLFAYFLSQKCRLIKDFRMETREELELMLEKIPKGKKELELKIIAK